MVDGLEFIKEIKVAQYWRKHLGEFEYLKYDPDDLRRWYDALELRGPLDIRDTLIERTQRHPMRIMTGIVATAPHPPREVVQVWLESHETARTTHLWLGGVAFLGFSWFVGTNLLGCSNLHEMNHFQLVPPRSQAPLPQSTGPAPSPGATNPAPTPTPAQNAARPTGGGPPH